MKEEKVHAIGQAIGRQLAQALGFAILLVGSWAFFEVLVRWPIAAAFVFAVGCHISYLGRQRRLRKAIAAMRESFEEIGTATPTPVDPVDPHGNTVH